MKIYISLPITGWKMEEVRIRIAYARALIEARGHEAVDPLSIQPDPEAPYAELMGRCVTALLGCDAVLMLPGWGKSMGCRLERRAAQYYGKKVIEGAESVPDGEAGMTRRAASACGFGKRD